jgi:hypothetical protein
MPERYGTLQRYEVTERYIKACVQTAGYCEGSTGLPAVQFCIALSSFVRLQPVVVVEDFWDCPSTKI